MKNFITIKDTRSLCYAYIIAIYKDGEWKVVDMTDDSEEAEKLAYRWDGTVFPRYRIWREV